MASLEMLCWSALTSHLRILHSLRMRSVRFNALTLALIPTRAKSNQPSSPASEFLLEIPSLCSINDCIIIGLAIRRLLMHHRRLQGPAGDQYTQDNKETGSPLKVKGEELMRPRFLHCGTWIAKMYLYADRIFGFITRCTCRACHHDRSVGRIWDMPNVGVTMVNHSRVHSGRLQHPSAAWYSDTRGVSKVA